MRPKFRWQLKTRSLELGARTLVMGILNVTPDSFSDGGLFLSPEAAIERGLAMLAEGADMLDVGGESTRPGAKVGSSGVTAEEELRRVLPVIKELRRAVPDAVVSIDTYKAETARQAVAAGAEIVNDVSGLRWDPEIAKACADLHCGVVLMHMRGRPEEWRGLPPLENPVETVRHELGEMARTAEAAGVARENIVVDPGFGFGKNFDENYPLLAGLGELHALGYPVLSATSRKSFIGNTLGAGTPVPPSERLFGSLATVVASILAGAHIVRVHDVKAARDAVLVADAILNAQKS